jgi:hypothetical protein
MGTPPRVATTTCPISSLERRRPDVVEGEAVGDEPQRIGRDVILPPVAADGVDLGDAAHGAELRPDHPVLDLSQVHRGPGRAVGFPRAGSRLHGPHEDLAQSGGDRAQRWIADTRRQRGARFLQTFVDELACEVDVDARRRGTPP